jgi:hypothetical protein
MRKITGGWAGRGAVAGGRARAAVLAAALCLGLLTGCARATGIPAPGATPTGVPPSGATPTGTPALARGRAAAVYTAVIKRLLTTGDSSFGADHRFPGVYVLDHARVDASDPMSGNRHGGEPLSSEVVPIDADTQASIIAALPDLAPITFVPSEASVIDTSEGCAKVRGDGILITLAPVPATGDRVEIGVEGFVACLGAVWLTYVVVHQGAGWVVTGKTGPEAIA